MQINCLSGECHMGRSCQHIFRRSTSQSDMLARMIAVAIELHETHGRYFAISFLEENGFGMGIGYWTPVIAI
ncbi:MAG: hypothetical protein V4582_20390 [Pseudomonadota bacterium]